MSTVQAPHSARSHPELRAGQAQLVAQRHGQRFLLRDVDAALLAVDVQRDQPLDRTDKRRVAGVEARNK